MGSLAGGRYRKVLHWGMIAGIVIGVPLSAAVAYLYERPEVIVSNTQDVLLTGDIRVMSANIAAGLGRQHSGIDFFTGFFNDEKAPGIQPLETLIQQEDIDIACFQEIEDSYIVNMDEPADIAENTRLRNFVYGQNFGSRIFANGNAVHSTTTLYDAVRFPQQKYVPLGWAHITALITGSKGILHTKVDYQGHELNLICSHLSSEQWTREGILGRDHEREYEIRQLIELAAQNTPAIVMGDMNTVPLGVLNRTKKPGEETWQEAQRVAKELGVDIVSDPRLHLFDPNTPPELPATSIGPVREFGEPVKPKNRRIIDYIFLVTSPDDPIELKINDTRHIHYTHISDHAPVITDISIEEK